MQYNFKNMPYNLEFTHQNSFYTQNVVGGNYPPRRFAYKTSFLRFGGFMRKISEKSEKKIVKNAWKCDLRGFYAEYTHTFLESYTRIMRIMRMNSLPLEGWRLLVRLSSTE